MKDKFLSFLISYIKTYHPDYNNEKLSQIKYGLEGIYLLITKTFIIFSIAYFIGILEELIILLLFYNFIRMFSFGLHATKSHICLIVSAFVFLTFSYIANFIVFDIFSTIFLNIIFIILFFKNSPADTYKKPIINKKRRKLYKFSSTIIVIILSFTTIFITNNFITNCIIFSLFIQSLLISPFVYSLFKLPYNNYKKYIKEKEGLDEKNYNSLNC